MTQLGDFWSVGKTDDLFEQDFYSSAQGIAYSVKSVRSELSPEYFSFWRRLLRKNFACVRREQQIKNPAVMKVECVGVPKSDIARAKEAYLVECQY